MTIKRLLLILGVLLILLIGVSIYSFAILLPSAAQTSPSTPTATPVQAIPTKISSVQRVIGTIQSIGNQTFVLALDRENKTVIVSVNAETTYITPDGSATFSELKVGELVEVRSHTDSLDTTTILAVSVIIKSAVA